MYSSTEALANRRVPADSTRLGAETRAGRTRPRRYVAAVGDANDPHTWCGIPYYLLQAGITAGCFDGGLRLSAHGLHWQAQRLLWNGVQWTRGDRFGGYQYSVPFLEWLWREERIRARNAAVINCFQLFPPSLVGDASVEKWFYIDQTLTQLFDHYGQRALVGKKIAAEAIARERIGYQAATGVIVHSRWTANSVATDYGIASDRIHVVTPGANIAAQPYEKWLAMQSSAATAAERDRHALKLVFIGKDWRRKGLPRLLAALQRVQKQSVSINLCVIGCRQDDLPAALSTTPSVQWHGFIDKEADWARFLALVGSCDVGCLLSTAEAGGIAQREFHALGLAVLGTTAGGAPEHADLECSWLVAPDAPVETIAAQLVKLARDPTWVSRAKAAAWRKRHRFLYQTAITGIQRLLEETPVRP